ncbi:MAG: orotate phosphoribosyltransferase [Bacteroidetes bacterium]|nr:MAG: orotate phosphoribosyltransferase [Bacteroidota bacterium]
MIYDKDIALQTAQFLLQIKAIKLNSTNPFLWSSGWKSPIYCDNRKILSFPRIRTYIREQIAKIILEEHPNADYVAGVATGGIAIGALVAQQLDKPFVYVRPPKSHGLKNAIEGVIEENSSVVVVEDLVSTGKSSLEVVKVLESEGHKVKGMISIFDYGFELAVNNFTAANCQLYSLSNYNTLLEIALTERHIAPEELHILNQWRIEPDKWGK